MKHIYEKKSYNYYSHSRLDLISLLPIKKDKKILEIGAGCGDTLVTIKEKNLASKVIGVELFPKPGTNQSNTLIDKFIIADIENDILDLENDYFDVIICGDVLEHLVDPWAVIEKLTHLLKKGGVFIISVPNIGHYTVLFSIIFKKDFKYDPEGGILDKTHLRFFCKKNIKQLVTTKNLQPVSYHAGFTRLPRLMLTKTLNIITIGLLKVLLTRQHLIVAKRIN